MDDIKTLVEEAKRLARDFAAAHLRETLAEATGRLTLANSDEAEAAMDAALDALAEAHQAEVARLTRENEGLAKDAARWRGAKARHGISLVRLATGGSGYSSAKKDGILDAWADMACAEIDAFDSDAFRADMNNRIAELQADAALAGASGADEGERT